VSLGGTKPKKASKIKKGGIGKNSGRAADKHLIGRARGEGDKGGLVNF